MTDLLTAETEYGKFSYWPNDGIGQEIAKGAFWDGHFRGVFDALTSSDTVIDIGANLGWFSIYAAKKGCRVYAFEAWSPVFELLKLNVEQNGVSDKVSIFPLALYDRCEKMAMIPLGPANPANQVIAWGRIDESVCRNSGSFALRPGSGWPFDQYAVPLDYFNISPVSVIKVDTEGCDLPILRGARETILRSKPVLCYEYLQGGARLEDYEALMAEYHYHADQVRYEGGGVYRDFIARPE